MIDAEEGRTVCVSDVLGSSSNDDIHNTVYVRIDGTLVESLVKVKLSMCCKYVTTVNGKKILYVKIRRALYGCLKSELLFWKHLSDILEQTGFELNPHDTCVANKTVDGHQCTIVWHVDDLKISHIKS